MALILWHQKMTLMDVQCDAKKTQCHLKSLAKNIQTSGQPLKSCLCLNTLSN